MALSAARAAGLDPTAEQVPGPFHPAQDPAGQGADLSRPPGSTAIARGTPILLRLQVLDTSGRALPATRLRVWQANAAGRYRHPSDAGSAPLDPNFIGYATLRADARGELMLRTVKPGAYPTGIAGYTRPPHIHFEVRGPAERLVTQMYFPGEALNDEDPLLQDAPGRDTLIAQALAAPAGENALVFAWRIVLAAL